MEAKIKVNCVNCDKEIEKEAREYRRQIKKGNTRFFCNNSCAAIKIKSEIERRGNPEYLLGHAGNRRDEFTPFRWFVLRAQYRDRRKKYGCNLTVQYLKQLWEQQKGICSLSGWQLILPKDSDGWKEYLPTNASLDRIDNNLGYIEGNVRFISVMANIARQSFTDEQLIEFCKAVADTRL